MSFGGTRLTITHFSPTIYLMFPPAHFQAVYLRRLDLDLDLDVEDESDEEVELERERRRWRRRFRSRDSDRSKCLFFGLFVGRGLREARGRKIVVVVVML